MQKRRRSPVHIRVPVAQKPGQVFRGLKGRGSYQRQRLKKQLRREVQEGRGDE